MDSPRLLTTFRELLSSVDLEELGDPIAKGPHAPLTLRKSLSWLAEQGVPHTMAALRAAGVADMQQRKQITAALIEHYTSGRCKPDPDEIAPVALGSCEQESRMSGSESGSPFWAVSIPASDVEADAPPPGSRTPWPLRR
jgi:hypothetical protein